VAVSEQILGLSGCASSSLARRTDQESQPTIESLAACEGKTERWIRRTMSLAFLFPALVKAAIDGRLFRGFGVKRLMDLRNANLLRSR
jgi:hypothetical protein